MGEATPGTPQACSGGEDGHSCSTLCTRARSPTGSQPIHACPELSRGQRPRATARRHLPPTRANLHSGALRDPQNLRHHLRTALYATSAGHATHKPSPLDCPGACRRARANGTCTLHVLYMYVTCALHVLYVFTPATPTSAPREHAQCSLRA